MAPGCNSFANVRPGAKSILEVFSPPPTEQAARWAINPYDADQRYKGSLVLANAPFAGEPLYIQLFVENATDQDSGVRAVSMRALGAHGNPEHAPLLIAGLRDEDVAVRTEAARALQRIHAPDAIDPLLDALSAVKEPEPAVRLEAASALGQYRTGKVAEQLIAALSDDDLAVNLRVQSSLRTLTGQDFGIARPEWQRWYKDTKDVFAGGNGYMYAGFDRERFWYENIPLFPQPPVEKPGIPAGLSPASTAETR